MTGWVGSLTFYTISTSFRNLFNQYLSSELALSVSSAYCHCKHLLSANACDTCCSPRSQLSLFLLETQDFKRPKILQVQTMCFFLSYVFSVWLQKDTEAFHQIRDKDFKYVLSYGSGMLWAYGGREASGYQVISECGTLKICQEKFIGKNPLCKINHLCSRKSLRHEALEPDRLRTNLTVCSPCPNFLHIHF